MSVLHHPRDHDRRAAHRDRRDDGLPHRRAVRARNGHRPLRLVRRRAGRLHAGRACSGSACSSSARRSRFAGERPSALAGLEPALLWERFSELTRIARPSKEEGAGARARSRLGGGARPRRARGRRGQCRRSGSRAGRARARRRSCSSRTSTWCASAIRRARSTRARDASTSSSTATGSSPTARRSAPTTASASRRRMAVADDPRVEHGPLELLFTVSEEQGLDGAKALDAFARDRARPRQPRRDERRRAHGRLRGERPHFLRSPHAAPVPADHDGRARRALRRTGRALGRRHRVGPRERDQGARARALARRTTHAPFGLAQLRRRREPERDSARRARASSRSPTADRSRFRGDRRGRARGDRSPVPRHRRRARDLAIDPAEADRRRRPRRDASKRSTSSPRSRPASIAMAPGLARRRRDEHLPDRREDGRATS